MCSTHWPKLLDLTKDEAKKSLRKLELDAYASIITAFRAQSDLTKEKKLLLQHLQSTLSISTERHKAEVRRAVNDEKLTTIADHTSGPNVSSEWLIEGRRLVPLMPRLVPQTAFTATADMAANAQAEKNASLPTPSQTGKDIYAAPVPTTTSSIPMATKANRPQSPPSNVVVLPSGMSIHIKGGVSSEDDDSITLGHSRKSRRSSSAESLPFSKGSSSGSQFIITTTLSSSKSTDRSLVSHGLKSAQPLPIGTSFIPPLQNLQNSSSKTIESDGVMISGSAQPYRTTHVKNQAGAQKVMMGTSSYGPGSSATAHLPLYQHQKSGGASKSMTMINSTQRTMPSANSVQNQQMHMASMTVTSASQYNMSSASSTSTIVTTASVIANTSGNVISDAGQHGSASAPSLGGTIIVSTHHQPLTNQNTPSVMANYRMMTSSTPSSGISHPRTRTIITRPRTPLIHHSHMGGGAAIYRSTTPGTPHIIKSSVSRPTIHIKQEGGMKIITHSVPGSNAKYITKHHPPSSIHHHSSSGSNVVVVTTVPSSMTKLTSSQGKMVSSSYGSRMISATRGPSGASVVTVNPKSFQITTVKGSQATTGQKGIATHLSTSLGSTAVSKSSLIVVQKSGHAPSHTALQSQHIPVGGVARKIGVSTTTSAVASGSSSTVLTPVPKSPPTAIQSPFEKELMSFIQRQDSQHRSQHVLQQHRTGHVISERRLAPKMDSPHLSQAKKITVVRQKPDGTTSSQPVVIAQAPSQTSKSSILAELIHPKQQQQQNSEDIVILEDEQAAASISASQENKESAAQNQWIEMDSPYDQEQQQAAAALMTSSESSDVSAISALLDLHAGGVSKVVSKGQANQPRISNIRTINRSHDPSSGVIRQMSQQQPVIEAENNDEEDIQFIQTEQGSLRVRKQPNGDYVTENGQTVQIELATEEDLAQIGAGQDIIGELDPNTGLLYSNNPYQGQTIIDTGSIQSITPIHRTTTSLGPQVSSISYQPTPHRISQMSISNQDTSPQVIYQATPQSTGSAAPRQIKYQTVGQQRQQQQSILISHQQQKQQTPHMVIQQQKPGAVVMDTVVTNVTGGGNASGKGTVEAADIAQQQLLAASSEEDFDDDNEAQYRSTTISGGAGDASMQKDAKGDFLSTALDSAQINLDPYKFMEEDEEDNNDGVATLSDRNNDESVPLEKHMREPALIRIAHQQADKQLIEAAGVSQVQGIAEHEAQALIQQQHSNMAKESTTEKTALTQQPPSAPVINTSEKSLTGVELLKPAASQIEQQQSSLNENIEHLSQSETDSSFDLIAPVSGSQSSTSAVAMVSAAVAVEPTGMVEQFGEFTSQKIMMEQASSIGNTSAASTAPDSSSSEEFSSQPHQPVPGFSGGSPTASSSQDSLSDSLNKRKRKAPPKPDEIIVQSQIGGWIRLALGLLQRVSKYRGLYKQKGDMNAASWFTHPVNPYEVTDYYNIIQTPMDFSTIKRKLEVGEYEGWNDFHADMMLIRDNCYQYNAEGSEVRLDCDEVFAFYLPEYDKALHKWHQSQLGSPTQKKIRMDKSPVKMHS